MGHILGALLACYLDLKAGNAGPCHRGAQQVAVLIDGGGLDRRPDESSTNSALRSSMNTYTSREVTLEPFILKSITLSLISNKLS